MSVFQGGLYAGGQRFRLLQQGVDAVLAGVTAQSVLIQTTGVQNRFQLLLQRTGCSGAVSQQTAGCCDVGLLELDLLRKLTAFLLQSGQLGG